MENFRKISPNLINGNVFKQIGKDWMLITAGTNENFNTMTASWGGMGVLWNKNVVYIFIRPSRFTYQFVEKSDLFTLSFFDENYRDALKFCGSKSGRDYDKMKETGLTPLVTKNNSIAFSQSRLILECKKIYYQDLEPKNFLEKDDIEACYDSNDYHRMYVGEIISCMQKI